MDWLRENRQGFLNAAREGKEDMKDLVAELRTRKEFRGVLERAKL